MNAGGGGGWRWWIAGFFFFKKKVSHPFIFLSLFFLSFTFLYFFLSIQDYMTWASEWCLWGGRGGLHPGPTNSSSVQAEGREIIG